MKKLIDIKWFILLFSLLLLTACTDEELSYQENFPFEVIVMPVREELAMGDTAEIRMSIQTREEFQDAKYHIRYFQFDGYGELRYYNENPYLPNDFYLLAEKEFRLYYTSQSEDTQNLSIWISDNFGNEKKIDFQFKNEN